MLRIEDTDAERSSRRWCAASSTSLRWLGVDWDEGPEVGGPHGPYSQSARLRPPSRAADALVADGHAYYCYCTTERLQAERAAAEARGEGWIYDRRCLSLGPNEIARMEAAGLPRAVRVRVPPGETTFDDLVHGPITIDHATIEDFVILRSDGLPTYQLSVVCDDIDMAITHVVRGDDHISNTPKQILLYRALGRRVPVFAHVPLILGPDKKRLSKRHGATSVSEYERRAILPEAFVNFLALLGWSPGGDQEIFSREELIARFSLDGISGGNAVFNPEKLEWFNAQHLARLPADDLIARVRPELEAAGLWTDDLTGTRREWFVPRAGAARAAREAAGRLRAAAGAVSRHGRGLRSGRRGEAPQGARPGGTRERARRCAIARSSRSTKRRPRRRCGSGRLRRPQVRRAGPRDAHRGDRPPSARAVRDAGADRPRARRDAARGAGTVPRRARRAGGGRRMIDTSRARRRIVAPTTRRQGRRDFLRTTVATAAGWTIVRPAAVRGSQANSRIEIGIVGCGGRGRFVGKLFEQHTPTKVVALHDYFADRVQKLGDELSVDAAARFTGLDGYKALVERKLDAVAIESPPYFHPEQAIAALQAGRHLYLAKPMAVDVPGCLAIERAVKAAGPSRHVLVDFQTRRDPLFREAAARVHRGDIGPAVLGHVYYHAGRLTPKLPDGTQTARLRNWVFDKALSGDIIVEQNIHVIDVANWYLRAHPIKARGTGGRKARVDVGDCWDHYVVTYTYPGDVVVDFSSAQFTKGFDDLRIRVYGARAPSTRPTTATSR